MQRQRYRLFRRKNGTYYAFENGTGRQTSLYTKDQGEATGLLAAKNQATAQPILNVAMAKVYLSAKSPELLTRIWQLRNAIKVHPSVNRLLKERRLKKCTRRDLNSKPLPSEGSTLSS
jgi:hypothetical protein